MTRTTVTATTATTVTVSVRCPFCGKETVLTLPREGWVARANGALIQDAFPALEADTREVLVSGLCKACQDSFFG